MAVPRYKALITLKQGKTTIEEFLVDNNLHNEAAAEAAERVNWLVKYGGLKKDPKIKAIIETDLSKVQFDVTPWMGNPSWKRERRVR